MATERKKAPRFTTPAGIAAYPRILGTPDTKFDEDGVWSIKVKFPDMKTAKPVIEKIKEAALEAKAEAKADDKFMANLKKKKKTLDNAALDLPYSEDEETGEVTVGFKMKASGISKKNGERWNMRPAVFDAQGAPVPQETKVGSGSKVKVAYELGGFHTPLGWGVSMRLVAVQILELVEWGQGSATSYGFEVEDAPEGTEAADSDDKEDADEDDGSDEF
jgi:hypothetical protein